MNISDLSPAQLRQAASLKEQLEALQKELANLSGAPTAPPAAAARQTRKKGKMSAAGRARIRAAQIARWAKIKKAQQPPKKKKFTMSAAAKAAISRAAKARWARIKAAQKK